MAKRNESMLAETETVIGAGVKVKGTLVSEGDITIDGELKGSIKAGGNLTIGVNAVIEANVSAKNVKVGGHLVGNINCENETEIGASGRVKGNIHSHLLSIGHGAVFSGQSTMSESALQPEVADETEPEPAE